MRVLFFPLLPGGAGDRHDLRRCRPRHRQALLLEPDRIRGGRRGHDRSALAIPAAGAPRPGRPGCRCRGRAGASGRPARSGPVRESGRQRRRPVGAGSGFTRDSGRSTGRSSAASTAGYAYHGCRPFRPERRFLPGSAPRTGPLGLQDLEQGPAGGGGKDCP